MGELRDYVASLHPCDMVSAAFRLLFMAHQNLNGQAAPAEVVYNDDTMVEILERMGRRAGWRSPESGDDFFRIGRAYNHRDLSGPVELTWTYAARTKEMQVT